MLDRELNFKQMVVWDKGPMGMGWHYRRSYETVLVAFKGKKCKWYDDTKRVENIIRPGMGIDKIIPSSEQHPTVKPDSLAAYFIKLHTQDNDIIMDSFMGSGTTGVAAQRMGRKFIGIEISEEYCEMSVRRITRDQPLFNQVK